MKNRSEILSLSILCIGGMIFIASSCSKDDEITLPVLTTSAASEITITSAKIDGMILSDGGAAVIASGLCWSLEASPTLSDQVITNTNGESNFSATLSDLSVQTTYFVRAFATNRIGTGYGNSISFTTNSFAPSEILFNPTLTYGAMSDIDGNVYRTIKIGTQTWMAENLKVTTFNDGTSIPTVQDAISWSELTTGALCDYNNAPANASLYGKLYNGYAIKTGKLCPSGWHIPSDADWTLLIDFLNDDDSTGGLLKETGTEHWSAPNLNATNESGFTALPAGYRYENGTFNYLGINGIWWHSTDYGTNDAWQRYLNYNSGEVLSFYFIDYKKYGFSVRCVKD